jgi:hypothetical protein
LGILIFGAGDMAARYLTENEKTGNKVVGFLDNDVGLHGRTLYGVAPVYAPESVSDLKYSKIIVASGVNREVRGKIEEQLTACGAALGNIEHYPQELSVDYHPRLLFFRNFAKYAQHEGIIGNIAECGVWTGETAKYLNRYFNDRKLWLFDTFEGYPEESICSDRDIKGFSEATLNRVQGTYTSVELVMGKMTFPENVAIRKGFFPDSAAGVDGRFCLVHIDMTLYQPTLDTLRFFWDKLECRGTAVVRDYFAAALPGAKRAVDDFEAELGHSISKAPLGDTSCIVLIKGEKE